MNTELLNALEELWGKYPHWRFGQLVCNVAGWADVNPWDVEDQQLLEEICKQVAYQNSLNQAESSEEVSP